MGLMDIKPHKVSSDLSERIVFLYGDPKSGKTSTAVKFPNHLLLAFEKGYTEIPGAMALPINSWTEFKTVLLDLDTKGAKEKYKTIIVDTADIAYRYCEEYILSVYDKPTIKDIGYGAGYKALSEEFDKYLRKIPKMGYGLVIISHAKIGSIPTGEVNEKGEEITYKKVKPTLDDRATNIVSRMADIYGYATPHRTPEGKSYSILNLRDNGKWFAGARNKYLPAQIIFSYNKICEAFDEAIEKLKSEYDKDLFDDDNSQNRFKDTSVQHDMNEEMTKVKVIIEKAQKDYEDFTPFAKIIVEARESVLGKGVTLGQLLPHQGEQAYSIRTLLEKKFKDLETELNANKNQES